MNAIELLMADHREVEVLFMQFKSESDEECKAGIAHMVCMCLTAHAMIEEELFYPAARNVLSSSDVSIIDDGVQEHAQAKQMIAQIETSSGSQLEQLMMQLEQAITHHVGEEEDQLFPKIMQSQMDIDSLGKEMLERKMEIKVELMMK